MHAVQNAKILNIISSIQVQILVRALRVLDILVIVIIVIIAAALIYIFWPLIVAIIIMAAGYFIYRWYMKQKRWNNN
jgi:Flp pilus assembly protein TadB